MPYVHVRGIQIYYEDIGEGPPLVVLHGLLGSIDASRRYFAEPLDAIAAKGVRVLAYDARGHGQSGYTTRNADYSWEALSLDMLGFIDAMHIEQASVYGGSMGAGVALVLAMDHPEIVDRLVLTSPPPLGRDMEPVKRQLGVLAASLRLVGPKATERLMTMMPGARNDAERADAMRGFISGLRRESIPHAIRGLLLEGPRLPAHRLERVQHPTLILTHPDDLLHPLASGEVMHARMPHARLAVAPAESYWRENPDALAHVIASFVKGETIAHGLPEKHLHEREAAPA